MASFSSSSLLLLLLFLFHITTTAASIRSSYPAGIFQSSLKKSRKNPKPKIPYETHYFPQILDHFTFLPKSYKTFNQKYLINRQYWKKGSPIFVYTGNEGDIDWFAANTGFLLDIAPKFHALLVFIEVSKYSKTTLSSYLQVLESWILFYFWKKHECSIGSMENHCHLGSIHTNQQRH